MHRLAFALTTFQTQFEGKIYNNWWWLAGLKLEDVPLDVAVPEAAEDV